jgi:C4-dicarboxylate transporter
MSKSLSRRAFPQTRRIRWPIAVTTVLCALPTGDGADDTGCSPRLLTYWHLTNASFYIGAANSSQVARVLEPVFRVSVAGDLAI